ncbi:DNA ligase ATP-dependent family protein [Cryptosporidium andersoni]|uniref:DNA ligase n=1 Tax=Cryptosporidium andersoni TaxID=117008 RepID=A0A1J4MR78_9CRYT|nr:DNA ligase ATP-dependent family protein [Cryptosporidium andersoni]
MTKEIQNSTKLNDKNDILVTSKLLDDNKIMVNEDILYYKDDNEVMIDSDSIIDSTESLNIDKLPLTFTKAKNTLKKAKLYIEELDNNKDFEEHIYEINDNKISNDLINKNMNNYKKNRVNNSNSGNLFSPFSINITESSENILSPAYDPSKLNKNNLIDIKRSSIYFSILVDALSLIESLKGTGSGSKKNCIVVLANLFRTIIYHNPTDLIPATYICLNKISPDYENREFGVGESIIIKCIAEVLGRSENSIKEDLASGSYEDLGEIAAASRYAMRVLFEPPRLTIQEVFNEMYALACIHGNQAQQKKRDKIKKLMVAAKQSEVKFIIRFLQGRLRIGVQQATVYNSLANSFVLTRNSDENSKYSDIRLQEFKFKTNIELDNAILDMEKAFRSSLCQLPNIEKIIDIALKGVTPNDLRLKCTLIPGIPCEPMLARPTKGISEILSRFEKMKFTAEYKYDGERAQIHVYKLESGNYNIDIFSRNLENITNRYPDVVISIKESLINTVEDCILDCEVVAYSIENEKILPFQVLSTRKRKDVNINDIKVHVCVFFFDCMHFNGNSLIKYSLAERREYLEKCILEIPNEIYFVKNCITDKIDILEIFLAEAIENNCEGLMVKTLNENASYEPSKRSLNWLKIKKDYIDGIMDSIDVVPIAAFHGKGKRCGIYGTFLLAVYNPNSEIYETICKIGTGFSEEILQKLYNMLTEYIISDISAKSYYHVDSISLKPDVWFEPRFVWEVKAADLSLSPVHTTAFGIREEGKGIGLRFPRFIRIREDKKPEDATTCNQIIDLFDSQFIENRKYATNTNIEQEFEDLDEDIQ